MGNTVTIEITGLGSVLFESSKRAKHVNISVKPFKGVRVAVPDGRSFKQAEEFVYSKTDWILRHLNKIQQYEKEGHLNSKVSESIDKVKAKKELTRRLKQLAERHDFAYNEVFIRNQRTRWGSCSSKNNISLNMNLVRLPDELIDYVILHELLHTREKNHSRAFWIEMDKLVGDGKNMTLRLKKHDLGLL
jgi:predicted metal-dependent hydrolase